ncbi:MAG: DUF4954 family protein [Kiritimatiellae bacterium]|nr:DUF4954 family protein [Kiritimatiellia bacterium]
MKTTLPDESALRALTLNEIGLLTANWCRAESWERVKVSDPFDPAHFKDVYFGGDVVLGPQTGSIEVDKDVAFPTGIYESAVINSRIGANVLIRRVGGHLSRCDVGEGAVIQNTGVISAGTDAVFGNGVAAEVANEAGGREVLLFDGLTSQTAYALAFFRHRPEFIKAIEAMIRRYADTLKGGRAVVGDHAVVRNVGEIVDVRIGPYARVLGAARLVDGTILSEAAAPTTVGSGVAADHFIIAEGAEVDTGCILTRTFVGQAVRMGRGFSSENSLFFCNSEAFHGEAVAVFAGPYTVTHHKGSLLIAGLLSFYNAGSSTNMSNHMYKLGPVHQGVIERGAKTGSGAYLLWPSRVGAFSVVLGKNFAWFDAGDFPFSYISGEGDGKSYLVPGMNLFTVGTKRDGAKWPKRDRRRTGDRRDLVTFDVFSPYTLAAMLRGEERLGHLAEMADRSAETVALGGLTVKRLLLRVGAKNYRTAINRHLLAEAAERIRQERSAQPEARWDELRGALAANGTGGAGAWMDFGGLLAPVAAVEHLCADVERGVIRDVAGWRAACVRLAEAYRESAWAYVAAACAKRWGKAPADWTAEELAQRLDELAASAEKFTRQVLGDAQKDYDESAKTGYGHGWDAAAREKDFAAVRGSYEEDAFVKAEREELVKLKGLVEEMKAWIVGEI